MIGYFEALYKFCLEFTPLEKLDCTEKNLVFLGASAIIGILVVLLDIASNYTFEKSFLGMHYSSKSKYLWIIVAWSFATVVVSYFGLIMGIFNSTIQSCVVVGISWLYIIVQLTNKYTKPKTRQR